jgi:hypothetical protein
MIEDTENIDLTLICNFNLEYFGEYLTNVRKNSFWFVQCSAVQCLSSAIIYSYLGRKRYQGKWNMAGNKERL